ncbi:DUF2490 domain-containing protein [Salinimicrobium catena]|uniref:DUF2490 domain-containing protein n=1 Tax=Salinimicrobium catena TaxID=390640 RepID=UPI002FE4D41D
MGGKLFPFLIIFFVLPESSVFAQNASSYFYENELGISLFLDKEWSMDIGVGNRGMLQERSNGERISGYQHDHLELNHFTNYKTNESLMLSLGLRYRFREMFNSLSTDEFRIIEQAEISPQASVFSHRVRLEQRFREIIIHRLRYELSFSRPLGSSYDFIAATEALYAVAAEAKPEAEQRFSIGIENTSFKDLELGLGFEYRMENYARQLAHEFFLTTELTLNLN